MYCPSLISMILMDSIGSCITLGSDFTPRIKSELIKTSGVCSKNSWQVFMKGKSNF